MISPFPYIHRKPWDKNCNHRRIPSSQHTPSIKQAELLLLQSDFSTWSQDIPLSFGYCQPGCILFLLLIIRHPIRKSCYFSLTGLLADLSLCLLKLNSICTGAGRNLLHSIIMAFSACLQALRHFWHNLFISSPPSIFLIKCR